MLGKKDNFWEMGEIGPCGPCSEIHVDLRSQKEREKIDGKNLVNQDHPLVIEIWNLVFIQYNRTSNGSLESLPKKHIDTGMGLERIIMAIQAQKSNYDTDLFQPLIRHISKKTGISYGKNQKTDVAIRVLSDHIRAISFAIADGQLPSNNKAGYVIRRILRRAVRYAYTFLNIKEPFLHELVPILKTQFTNVFPEIGDQTEFIMKVIKEEERNFLNTLEKGLNLINEVLKNLKKNKETLLGGNIAFKLYDTFGFPFDLTELIAREQGFKVDIKGFKICMDNQKERSRQDAKVSTGDWKILRKDTKIEFIGYDSLSTKANIVRVREMSLKNKTDYQIVLDKTPFYPESGGQIGDKGYFLVAGEKIHVLNTRKENDLIIHYVNVLPKVLNEQISCFVNTQKRKLTTFNHSATHLLHAALRQVLGKHVEQKGSLVDEHSLRFDFSHFEKINESQIKTINNLVNEKIRLGIALEEERDLAFKEAQNRGAMALFGEKYGNKVRVITFDKNFSIELCGGTHVENTHQIGFFKIISESSVAAGVRRIEAFTAQKAIDYVDLNLQVLNNIRQHYKNPKDIEFQVVKTLKQNNEYEKIIKKLEQNNLKRLVDNLYKKTKPYNTIITLFENIEIEKTEHLRLLAFELRKQLKECFFGVLVTIIKEKPYVLVVLSDDMQKKGYNANKIINQLAKQIDGKGGGQTFLAIAGGKNKSNLKEVLKEAKAIIS